MNRTSTPDRLPVFKIAIYVITGLIALSALLGATYVVEQGRYGLVQRFGQIISVAQPGLHFKTPFLDSVGRKM